RIVTRLPEQTSAWEGHVEGILSQVVAALRQGHVDASSCDVKLTLNADVESFLRIVGIVESAVYDMLDERRVAPPALEMRLLAAWFAAVRDKTLRGAIRGLTAMLDSMPDQIHAEDNDGRFIWLNRSMATFLEQLTGLSRNEVIGRDAMEILERATVPIPESFREMIRRTRERAWHGESFQADFLLPTAEGPRWRSHSVAPVRAPDGTIDAMTVANRDIHARKAAEARLQLLSKVGTLHEVAEYEGVLSAVARLSIPELADWCVVDVVENGRVRRAKVAHRDPSKVALAEEILQIEHPGGSFDALGEGIIRVGDAVGGLFESNSRLADVVSRLGAVSIMIVPFIVLGAPIAVAVFVFTPESGRRHGPEDLALAQEMARRAAQIIENARLHEKLRLSEQRFRIALSRSNISVFEEDTELRIRWIYNSPFGGDVTGATIYDYVPAEVIAQLEAVKRRVLETGEGAATACDFLVGGERRHFLLRYEALHGVAGIVGITGAAIDVTELKRAQDELAQALGFRDRVIGVLGHDLRNPLSAVTGLAGLMLQQEQVSDSVRESLERMLKAGDRMNDIIETVLEFTRLRYGAGPQLSLSPAELDGIASAIVDELRVSHPGRAIEIATKGDLRGQWDVGRIGQVVSNLVGNALTHGAHEAPVQLSLTQEDANVELVVSNRGATIPAEHVAQLFEPFWQAPPDGQALRRKGLGLGLWIVREIVRHHGGTIDVRSADEVTAFTVRLPRQPAG
ncbi:MAG TPA: ATP-binding protein, partial [Polyangia bacterium]|nr:ATP-binding protein [Polyangia bacterium]